MISRSFARSWRARDRAATVPERERMTSDSVVRAAAALVAHALQHVAVGDAGGREEAVVAARRGRRWVSTPVEVVAGVERGLALVVVARPQPADHLAADRT